MSLGVYKSVNLAESEKESCRIDIEKDGPFTFRHIDELHTTYCWFNDSKSHKVFFGQSVCHPDDYDVETKLIGQHIAASRAIIKGLIDAMREIEKELKTFKQFYYTINRSKKYNSKSYEAKMLNRQIKMRENQIKNIQETIDQDRKYLKEYINDKEKAHQRLRKLRAKQDKND